MATRWAAGSGSRWPRIPDLLRGRRFPGHADQARYHRDGGLPFLLQAAVGTQRALEIIATVRRVYAAEALALGLVLEVVPPEKLVERALEIAGQVAQNPPLGVAAAKRLVYMAHQDDLSGSTN